MKSFVKLLIYFNSNSMRLIQCDTHKKNRNNRKVVEFERKLLRAATFQCDFFSLFFICNYFKMTKHSHSHKCFSFFLILLKSNDFRMLFTYYIQWLLLYYMGVLPFFGNAATATVVVILLLLSSSV